MSDFVKQSLVIAFALASIGCSRADDLGPKQSVTVQLPPARPLIPEPGFTLSTDPARGSNQVQNKADTLSGA